MDKKEFRDPNDQGVYQLESKVISIIFGFVLASLGWKIIVPVFQLKSPEAVVGMLALSFVLILIGGVLYTEWIYRIGRNGWVARIAVNAVTILAFLVLYVY